ncbi:methyl-accepting chemotaxis protein [Clostridium bowmanii]|uniref:methyl-accepting chemotaxis protein n=1 Tax=Clostridium bowmanii TaxID=132925 RepID=UPI001C0DFDB4|nr:methyl-accepting chemotaxis protein [Clostridium bowmanii]MBU3188231.1 methyl-accepting chemotaxis protein [Clostridium bowmanii]MCA1072617.1 methyl-accepting chemotaxis protein [Clostridium bowmanii]
MKKISTKIILMAVSIVIFTSLCIGTYVIIQNFNTNKSMVSSTEKIMRDNFDAQIKYQVQNAVSMLEGINKRLEKNEITLEQAKKIGEDQLRGLKYGKNGYFWADTEEGINIVLNGTPTEGTNRFNTVDAKGKFLIKDIIANGMKEDGGFTDYWFPKKGESVPLPKRGYSLEFKPFKWIIGTGNYVNDIDNVVVAKETELNKKFTESLISLIAINIFLIVVSAAFAWFFSKRITKPILLITELVDKTANLDLIIDEKLTDQINCYKDETGQIGRAVNNLRKDLRDITVLIKSDSNEIIRFTDQLSKATGDTVVSIKAVTQTVEELAKGSVSQASDSQEISENLSSLADEIDIAVASSSQVKILSEEVKTVNQSSKNTFKVLKMKLEKNNEASQEVSRNIDILSTKSTSIGEIVSSIQAIAAQTNLLALNAAIEAARAGESGRGFAVVADEIRKLAEQTAVSTKEIGDVIQEIQKEIDKANSSMNIGNHIVQEVEDALKETDNSFAIIEDSIDNTLVRIGELTENVSKVDADKSKIVLAFESISAVSEESAAATEEVSASMDEQLESMESISTTSEELRDISYKLEKLISKFKI